jgi:hypothetical protein
MSSLVRNILALLAGAVVAIVLIGLLQAVAHGVYPPPPGLDYKDPAVLRKIMMEAPVGALLMVLLSYFIGTFVGASIAARLSADVPERQAYLIGGMMLVSGVMNLMAIPHPVWFWAGSIVAFISAAFLGAKIGAKKTPAGRVASL